MVTREASLEGARATLNGAESSLSGTEVNFETLQNQSLCISRGCSKSECNEIKQKLVV